MLTRWTALALALATGATAAAQDRPQPVPPVMPAPMPAASPGQPHSYPELIRQSLDLARQSLPRNERGAIVEATWVGVPRNFCDRVGLTEETSSSGRPVSGRVWVLSQREHRMLMEVLKAEPKAEILQRPAMQLVNDQKGFFQIKQSVEVAAYYPETQDGQTVLKFRTNRLEPGMELSLTPKIDAKGQTVMLDYTIAHSSVNPTPVILSGPVQQAAAVTAMDCQSMKGTVAIRNGGAVVIGGIRTPAMRSNGSTTWGETLWILAPHVFEGTAQMRPPVPAVKK